MSGIAWLVVGVGCWCSAAWIFALLLGPLFAKLRADVS
jgi:hypothetical protein